MTAVLIVLWGAVTILLAALAVVLAATRTRGRPRFYPPSREALAAARARAERDRRIP